MNEDFMKSRLEENRALVAILQQLIEQNPTLRFSQILCNYDFIKQLPPKDSQMAWKDEFYTEPKEVLDRVSKALGF